MYQRLPVCCARGRPVCHQDGKRASIQINIWEPTNEVTSFAVDLSKLQATRSGKSNFTASARECAGAELLHVPATAVAALAMLLVPMSVMPVPIAAVAGVVVPAVAALAMLLVPMSVMPVPIAAVAGVVVPAVAALAMLLVPMSVMSMSIAAVAGVVVPVAMLLVPMSVMAFSVSIMPVSIVPVSLVAVIIMRMALMAVAILVDVVPMGVMSMPVSLPYLGDGLGSESLLHVQLRALCERLRDLVLAKA